MLLIWYWKRDIIWMAHSFLLFRLAPASEVSDGLTSDRLECVLTKHFYWDFEGQFHICACLRSCLYVLMIQSWNRLIHVALYCIGAFGNHKDEHVYMQTVFLNVKWTCKLFLRPYFLSVISTTTYFLEGFLGEYTRNHGIILNYLAKACMHRLPLCSFWYQQGTERCTLDKYVQGFTYLDISHFVWFVYHVFFYSSLSMTNSFFFIKDECVEVLNFRC